MLTPEYQKRMVQMNYHEGVDNSPQWNASFCYPEGFMRWWSQASQGGNFQLTMNVNNVQFLSGIAANFLRQVLVGKEHVQKVPQWYGETVGFWDGTTLVTWTANVQGWTISHSMFEFSDKIETVETYAPVFNNGTFVGLKHEAVFYDPDAFVQPLHVTHAVQPASRARQCDAAIYLYRMLEQSPQYRRKAQPAHREPIRGSSTTMAVPGPRTGKSISRSGWDKPRGRPSCECA